MSKTSPLASHYKQYSFIRSLASFLSVLLIFVCDRFLLFVFCFYDLTQDFSRCITFCHLCYPYHHFLFRSCIINKDCDTFQFGYSCVPCLLTSSIFARYSSPTLNGIFPSAFGPPKLPLLCLLLSLRWNIFMHSFFQRVFSFSRLLNSLDTSITISFNDRSTFNFKIGCMRCNIATIYTEFYLFIFRLICECFYRP